MKRIAGFALVAAQSAGCAAVPPQHVGVVETFGSVHSQTLQVEEQTNTPTGEGLLVGLDVSLVFAATNSKFVVVGGKNGLPLILNP